MFFFRLEIEIRAIFIQCLGKIQLTIDRCVHQPRQPQIIFLITILCFFHELPLFCWCCRRLKVPFTCHAMHIEHRHTEEHNRYLHSHRQRKHISYSHQPYSPYTMFLFYHATLSPPPARYSPFSIPFPSFPGTLFPHEHHHPITYHLFICHHHQCPFASSDQGFSHPDHYRALCCADSRSFCTLGHHPQLHFPAAALA